jgi:hypothetical protein
MYQTHWWKNFRVEVQVKKTQISSLKTLAGQGDARAQYELGVLF